MLAKRGIALLTQAVAGPVFLCYSSQSTVTSPAANMLL